MVPIRTASRDSNSNSYFRPAAAFATTLAVLSLSLLVFFFSRETGVSSVEGNIHVAALSSSSSTSLSDGIMTDRSVDKFNLVEGVVTFSSQSLPYYRCGASVPSSSTTSSPRATELVLLHGAAFTKEDWRTSGILEQFCTTPALSVTALDLSVKSTGDDFGRAFDALVAKGVLSGKPAVVVTPSASGKALVHLGESAAAGGSELGRMVAAWIPVASPAVLKASDEGLRSFSSSGVPVLAIHGTKDERGKDVTKRLVEAVGATGVELEGRHPVYIDSPHEFVEAVLKFLTTKEL